MIVYKESKKKVKSFDAISTNRDLTRGSFVFVRASGATYEASLKSLSNLATVVSMAESSQNREKEFRRETDLVPVSDTLFQIDSWLEKLLDLHLEYASLIVIRNLLEFGESPVKRPHISPNAFTQFFGDPTNTNGKTRTRRLLAASKSAYGIVTSNSIGRISIAEISYSWVHETLFSRIERAYANRIRASLKSNAFSKIDPLEKLSQSAINFGSRADIAFFIAMQTMRDKRLYGQTVWTKALKEERFFIQTLLRIAKDTYRRLWCIWTSDDPLCFGDQPLARYEVMHSPEGFLLPLSRRTLLNVAPIVFAGQTHSMITPIRLKPGEQYYAESKAAILFYESRLIDKIANKSEVLFCHPDDWRAMWNIFKKSNPYRQEIHFKSLSVGEKPLPVTIKEFSPVTWTHQSIFDGHDGPKDEITFTESGTFESNDRYWVNLARYAQRDVDLGRSG